MTGENLRSGSVDSAKAGASSPGTVTVTIAPNVTAAKAWQALTEPSFVGRWFGTPSGVLRPGGSVGLDFGDGDFFEIEDIHLDPPNRIQYAWRFMGTGPQDSITWHITPKGSGCLVTVTDYQPERSREEAHLLRQGWLDFTQRLEQFLATSQSTRYDWRREFDAAIELPGTIEAVWGVLFSSGKQTQWLPLSTPSLEAGAPFTLDDNAEPPVLEVTDVIWNSPSRVAFQLAHSHWLHPTSCQLELSGRRHSTVLSVSHVGWEAISLHSADQLRQRKRFSQIWVTALKAARQLVEQEHRT